MWVQKYDYSALKLEFFQSEYDEVKSFLSDKWVTYNTKWTENTKGWSKEKKAWKEKIVEKALEKKQNELAKKLEIPMEWMLETKKATIQLIRRKLNAINEKTKDDWNSIDIKDVKTIREISKVELWEPTSVSKNDNTNSNKTALSLEDKELIDNYFNNLNNGQNTNW